MRTHATTRLAVVLLSYIMGAVVAVAILGAYAKWASAAVPAFCGDTVRGLADHNCSTNDGDRDGFTDDGTDDYYSVGSATVDGNHTGAHSITVDTGHTIKSGAWVSIPLSGGGTAEKHVLLATPTKITFIGAINVDDNATISAMAAIDCDDTNMWQHPGTWSTTGCSAGQHKQCLPSGSYSSCKAIECADFSTTNSCKWVDGTSGNDTTGNGSESTPWKSFSRLGWYYYVPDDAPAGYYSLAPGDVVFLKGTISDPYDPYGPDGSGATHIWNGRTKDGTAGNPIRFISYPGQRAVINNGGYGGGTHCGSPISIQSVHLYQQDYVLWEDTDVTGNNHDGTGSGPAVDGTYVRILRNKVYGNECYSNDNCAGIYIHPGSTAVDVTQNVSYDIERYTDSAGYDCGTNPGDDSDDTRGWASPIIMFRLSGANIAYNQFGFSNWSDSLVAYVKHGDQPSIVEPSFFHNNTVFNGSVGLQSGQPKFTTRNNTFLDNTVCVRFSDGGGTTYDSDVEFSNNTCVGGERCYEWEIEGGQDLDGTCASDGCDGCLGDAPNGPMTFERNICSGQSGAFHNIHYYGSAPHYDRFVGATKTFDDNTFWRTGADSSTTAFQYFAASSGCGTACGERKCWGAATTMATACSTFGLECTDSDIVDPELDADYITTTVSSAGRGWFTGETTTTSTTTTTTLGAPVAANGGAFGRFRR